MMAAVPTSPPDIDFMARERGKEGESVNNNNFVEVG